MVFVHIILLILGFGLLLFGANWLVDGASSLARKYNVSNLVIGLTIIAFGTSAPELVVNIMAAGSGSGAIVLGNIAGSNIFNIFIILGITAMFWPLRVQHSTTWIEVPLSVLSALVLLVICSDHFIDHRDSAIISRSEGIMCLFYFLIFIVYNIRIMQRGEVMQEELPVKMTSPSKALLLIIAGFAGLIAGGKLIVDHAVEIARIAGLSERIIAITIVSAGTSLPEIAASIAAARKRNVDLAIGNIVGSNIFNVFFILGTSVCVAPVVVPRGAIFDLLMNLSGSLLLFLFIFTGKGRRIDRKEGIVFVLLYAGYLVHIWPK